ncbi:unnamed protein product [Closterium sp. NIES-54]
MASESSEGDMQSMLAQLESCKEQERKHKEHAQQLQETLKTYELSQLRAQELQSANDELRDQSERLLAEIRSLEMVVAGVESFDPRRPNHRVRLLRHPSFMCSVCRGSGSGIAWRFAEVENHEKAPAVAPPDFIPFEPIDEGLCASPTVPVLEQDSSSPSVEETAAVPVAKKNAKYTQSTLPWCKMGGNARATPPSPADQWSTTATAGTQVSPSVPEPSKPAGPDAIYVEALYKYKSEWLDRFSWLIFLKSADGLPPFKCSICTEHAGYAGLCRRGGKGATDVQTQAFKRHAATTKHKEAFKHQEKLLSEAARQPWINGDNLARNTEKERVIKLLDSLIFVTKQDAPIELWVNLVRYLASLKVPDTDSGTWLHTMQLQHILSSPFLGVTCDESTDRCRGKHLIIFATFIRENRVVTEFLALLTVEKGDAASLLSVFLPHLQALGIDLARIFGMSTDGASVMMGKNNGVVARLRLRIPHLVSSHCIAHREALAAKDATKALLKFEMVDSLLRQVAEHLGSSGPWHQRFMSLQEVFTATNLELQGIHQVRWLSRGDAILRAVEVFPALIVMLYEWDSTLRDERMPLPATRVVFGTEEHPLPGPASQHLRGILRGVGVGTFDAHGFPRPYTKEKFLEIYSHQRDSTKNLTVAQEEELARCEAEELRQRSLAESHSTFAWSGWGEEESASNEGGWGSAGGWGTSDTGGWGTSDTGGLGAATGDNTGGWGAASGSETSGWGTSGKGWGASREDQRGEEKEIEAEPPVVTLGRPPRRTAPVLPPPNIQPGTDPWDTIDWGNEPSTPRRTVYGPAPEPRKPTFFPGTIPGTNIPLSTILDKEFLALMLMTANGDDEAEETAAKPAQAPDEDPAEAYARYMRTSGFRADDAI